MTVVVAAVGVALVLWSIGLSLFYASLLRRRGQPTRGAVRLLLRRPMLGLGVTLIVVAIDPVAGAALLVVFVLCALVFVARRVRRLRHARR
jgi:cell division protein FtsW (lipid II flippase)